MSMPTNASKQKPQHTSKKKQRNIFGNIKQPLTTHKNRFYTTNVMLRRVVTRRSLSLLAALPECLVKCNATRYCRVERVDLPAHRQLHQQVAVFAHQPADALALVTNDERQWTRQIGLVIFGFGLSNQPDDPDILFLQVIDSACKVGLLGEEEMLGRPSRAFDDCGIDFRGVMQG